MHADLNLAGLRLWHTDPEWSCLLPAPAHAAAGALLLGDAAAQVHAGHAQLQSQGGSQGADSDYAPCLLRPDELAALEPGLAEGERRGARISAVMSPLGCHACTIWQLHGFILALAWS